MIFASDLDRTLIYSDNFVEEGMDNIVSAEKKDGADLSYISEKSKKLLSIISEKAMFVPVTSRSLEQFNRVTLLKEVKIKYAVVANGGIVLKNNEIDKVWEEKIENKMSEIITPEELLLDIGEFLKHSQVKSYRCCDKLFDYIVLKSQFIEEDYLENLSEYCNKKGYSTVKNGRKIYIIPYFMNKWEPLKYIMDLEQDNEIITAGDSILDFPMLKNSVKGFIPAHGELNIQYKELIGKNKNLICTRNEGVYSSEEFLNSISDMVI